MKVGIVILNFNGENNTIQCLNSIKKLEFSNDLDVKIYVVDNRSSDGSIKQIQEFIKINPDKLMVKLVENNDNLGFAGGNNVGIKSALNGDSDYILILNNDTIIDKNLIKELLTTVQTDEKIGIVVPKIYFEKGYEFHKTKYKKEDLGKVIWYAGGVMDWKNILGSHRGVDKVDKGQFEEMEETEIATGCCMLIKKEVLEKVGLFDEKYFLYYEDADFCQRVKKAGYKIIYCPKAIIWHKNAGSTGGSGSALQDYYITRNRMVFGFKYASLRSKLALAKESLKLLFFGRKQQKKGILDFYLKNFRRGNI